MAKISPSQVWLKDWENRYSLTKNIIKRVLWLKTKLTKTKGTNDMSGWPLKTEKHTPSWSSSDSWKEMLKMVHRWLRKEMKNSGFIKKNITVSMISFLSKTVSSNDILDGSQLKVTEMPWLTVRQGSGGGIGFLHTRFPPHPSKVAPKTISAFKQY